MAEIRRERAGKVGHAGTLDPFATGLLLVLLGRATRLQRYLLELPKTYVATARLGWRSSTGDPDGELEETGRIPKRLELPTGEIEQRVPMTSAVKVDGERLYKKAHRGESVETPTRRVTVHRAELLDSDGERATFEIECSSGTYIRTLIETLEDAYCETAATHRDRRTGGARRRPGRDPGRGADVVPAGAPARRRARRRRSATDARCTEPFDVPPEHVRLTHDGRLIAVARPDGENLRPEVVLV